MTDLGILVRAPGGPEAMEWGAVPDELLGPGDVRITQRAVGVNFIDVYFRSGLYPWPTTPLIPGAEAAGIVEEVGAAVTEFVPGDRVAYVLSTGAYRTRRVVPADRLVKIPDSVSFEVAASMMLKGMTAHFLLTSCFAVKAGHIVLVHAAAGGVGLLLGQWLKALGAVAIGTVGSDDKKDLARANGYTHVINYRSDDFVARTRELTAARGCDVVYDSVGQDTWRGSLKCLKSRGLFVSFGQSSGAITEFKLSDLAAGGSLFASRPTLFDYIKSRTDLQGRAADLFARLSRGELTTRIGQTWPLREAADAHRALQGRLTQGASVLVP